MFCIGTLKEATKKLIKETQHLTSHHGQQESSKQSIQVDESHKPGQPRDDEFHGRTKIKLKKLPGEEDFGIVTTGSGRHSNFLKLAYIKPGTPAFRHDGIEVGDYITALEGKAVSNLTSNDLSNTLHNRSVQQISIELDYTLPNTNQTSFSVINKRIEVKIPRDEYGSLGLTLRGGSSSDASQWKPITVTQIKAGGPVDREGTIKIGDRILSVNHVSMRQESLDNALRYLKSPDNDDVIFLVEYDVSVLEVVQNATGPLLVEIDKLPGCSLGVTLDQGYFKGHRVMYITEVIQASIADRCGALHHGDHILAIDGYGLEDAGVDEANEMLRINQGHQIQLEIVPAKLVLNHTTYASHPPTPQQHLFTKHSLQEQQPSYTKQPQLQQQQLLAKQQIHTKQPQHHSYQQSQQNIPQQSQPLPPHLRQRSLTLPQVTSQLTTQQQKQLQTLQRQQRLTVTSGPRKDNSLESDESHEANESSENSKSTNHDDGRFSSASLTSLLSNNTYNSMTTQVGSAMLPPCHLMQNWGPIRNRLGMTSNLGIPLCSGATGGMLRTTPHTQICHIDVVEVVLVAEKRNFGLQIDPSNGRSSTTFDNNLMSEPPVISYIEPRGPAERCGVLQEGDRVLAINGENLEGQTIDEIDHMIGESGVKIILLVEFDVAESIIPSSGVFIVKLAKRSAGLGVTISCPQNRKPGQNLVISDVKKGSVAHRTGSIQPGDKLLAIDNVRLDDLQCSLEDSARILQDTHDIVKLTIQKDEGFADEPDPSNLITYTVELPKFAGPVGIMVSGSEEPFGPIYISSLLPGGMAERTGALHVGDRLLAINGTSLRGKTPTDAVHLLQNAGPSVTLKITRPANKRVPDAKLEKGLGSMDSALESWGSSAGVDNYLASGPKVFCHTSLKHRSRSQHYFDSVNEQSDEVSNDMTSEMSPVTTHNQTFLRQSSIENPATSITVTTSSSDAGIDTSGGGSVTSNAPLPSSSATENVLRWQDREFNNKDVGGILISGKSGMSSLMIDTQDGKNGEADEWSKRLDELDKLRLSMSPVMDSFSDLPDIAEVIAESSGDRSMPQEKATEDVAFDTDQINSKISQPPPINESQDRTVEEVSSIQEGDIQLKEVEEQLQNIFTPTPIELLKIVLTKVKEKDDFGFSLSDGVFEKGVYVSAIRPGGPASSKLRQFDKILQVNSTKTRDMECSQLVPLIATSGLTVELVITRNPLLNMPKTNQHLKQQIEKGGSLKSFKEHKSRHKRLSTDFRSSTSSPRSGTATAAVKECSTFIKSQIKNDCIQPSFANITSQSGVTKNIGPSQFQFQTRAQLSEARETYIGEDNFNSLSMEDDYGNPFPSSKNGTVRRKTSPPPINKNSETSLFKSDTGKS